MPFSYFGFKMFWSMKIETLQGNSTITVGNQLDWNDNARKATQFELPLTRWGRED